VIVFLMAFQMGREVTDTFGENGDLHFGRAGVSGLGRDLLDHYLLADCRHRHRLSFREARG
jgi:hypothetical protein